MVKLSLWIMFQANEFDDISGNLQEESTNVQEEKKRVTYEDLWMQHREQQMKSQFSDIQKYKLIFWQFCRKINFLYLVAIKFRFYIHKLLFNFIKK